jgi:hypothetical protein
MGSRLRWLECAGSDDFLALACVDTSACWALMHMRLWSADDECGFPRSITKWH